MRNKIAKKTETIIIFWLIGLIEFFCFPCFTSASVGKYVNYQGKLTNTSDVAVADGAYNFVFKIYSVAGGGSASWTESWTDAALWTETDATTITDGDGGDCPTTTKKIAYTTGTNESSLAAGQQLWNTTIKQSSIIESVSTGSNFICVFSPASTWSDGNDLTNRIYVKNGIFSVSLGTITALTENFTSANNFLGVTVGADSEMKPRKRMTAVPQAINSLNVVGDGYVDIDNTSTAQDAANINYNPASGTHDALSITYGSGGGTGTALNISQAGSGFIFRANDDGTLTDSTPFVIDAGGNVGIGTTSPLNKLHVQGTGAGAAGIYLNDAVPGNTDYALYNDNGTLKWDGSAIGGGSGATTALDNLASVAINTSLISDTDSTDDLGSSSKYWANTYTDQLFTTGNVGIGTTLPSQLFQVNNSSSSAFVVTSGGNVGIGTTSPSKSLEIAYGHMNFVQVTAPTALTAALAGVAGNVDNGNHRYAVSYVTSNGETELGTYSNTVTVVDKTSDGQVSLTGIPTSSNPLVTSRKIYRTKIGSTTDFYLLTTIANNTTTIYTDNTADSSLTTYINSYYSENTTAGKLYLNGQLTLYSGLSTLALGTGALAAQTSGNTNHCLGINACASVTTSSSNTALGYNALITTTGSGSVAVGAKALWNASSNGYNTAVGSTAGRSLTTGYNNTFIGAGAGYDGSQKVNAVNSMALGVDTFTTADNQVVIGNTSITQTLLRGNVGIGTTNPTQLLSVGAGNQFQVDSSGNTTAAKYNNLTLTSNADGFSVAGGTASRTLTVTGSNITLTGGGNTLTMTGSASLNQSVLTSSTPQFAGLTLTGAMTINDDQLLQIGTSADGVILNRSSSLTANTTLSGVIVGTPVTSAIVANSTIFSNITSDADMVFITNDGGNSKELLRLTGATPSIDIGTGTTSMTIDSGGNVGIGTTAPAQALDVTGKIRYTVEDSDASNNYACYNTTNKTLSNCTSLREYKENIVALGLGLETVVKLNPVQYTVKESGETTLGFIAEDVEAISPLLADYAGGKLTGVKMPQMSALLTRAVQQLASSASEQQGTINTISNNQLSISNEFSKLNDQTIGMDDKLNIISGSLTNLDTRITANATDIENIKTKLTAAETKLQEQENNLATFESSASDTLSAMLETENMLTERVLNHEDRIKMLEEKMATVSVSGGGEIPSNVLTLDENGNVKLAGIFQSKEIKTENVETKTVTVTNLDAKQTSTDESVSGLYSVKTGDIEASSLGEAEIAKVSRNENGSVITDGTGNNGRSVFVETKAVSENSQVFVTSKTILDQPLVVTEIKPGEGFKVAIKNPSDENIKFSWWVVDKK